MTWHYAAGGRQLGPVDDAELDRLIATGIVTPDTLVWRAGMADWQPLSAARPQAPPRPAPPMTQAPGPGTQPRFGSAPGPGGPSGLPGGGGNESPDECYARVMRSGRSLAIGDIVGRAWRVVIDNFGLAVGAFAVVFVLQIISLVLVLIPCLGVLAAVFISWLLTQSLHAFYLKMSRRQPAEFGDAFSGFSFFMPLFLLGLVQGLLFVVAMAPGGAVMFIGAQLAERGSSEAAGVGLLALGALLLLPILIYLGVAWIFAPMLVMDKGYDFWPAMELSRKVATKHFVWIFLLQLLNAAIVVAGELALCLGLFVAIPITYAAVAIAYDDLFGHA
jgi:hypothetical protein